MVRGSWFVKKETAACATVSLGVLNFQFVVNRKSTSQTASGDQLSYEVSLFRSPLWTVRLSWPGGSGRFHTILERFCGPSPGLQDIGAEFFQINNTESFWSDFVDS